MDESLPPQHPDPHGHYAPVAVAAGQPHTADKHDGTAKGSAIGIALLVHALIFLLLTFIVLQTLDDDAPELIVESSASDIPVKIDPKKFNKASKPDPSAPSMAKSMVITAEAPSFTAITSVEDTEEFEIGMGDAFGAGLGIGLGGSGGGGVGFFGSKSTAQRVAFIIDVSASLSNTQFKMIKDELSKSLNRLAANIQYQVIFFSGPTWFSEDEIVSQSKLRATIKSSGEKFEWVSTGGASNFGIKGRKDLPSGKWKMASKSNLNKTKKQIEEVRKSYGTDWEWPLKMALALEPKPDVIYFLTDGATGNVKKTLDEVQTINRRGKKAKINSISMMQPRAATDLRRLAKDSGGKFTIVHEDGSVTVDGERSKPSGKKKKK